MKALRLWTMIALIRIGGELQWTSDRMGHLTTDPACSRYRAPRTRSSLDRASRGLACAECMVARAFGADGTIRHEEER